MEYFSRRAFLTITRSINFQKQSKNLSSNLLLASNTKHDITDGHCNLPFTFSQLLNNYCFMDSEMYEYKVSTNQPEFFIGWSETNHEPNKYFLTRH